MLHNNIYGTFRSRTFSNVFPDFNTFNSELNSTVFIGALTSTNIEKLYYLLYANYGNSHIASSDENRFKYNLFSIIWQYGPTWEKKLEVQQSLRNLSLDELKTGSYQITIHGENDQTQVADEDHIEYVGSQNKTKQKRSTLEAYANLLMVLESDVTKAFLDKFKKLFLTIVAPEIPILYETDTEVEL